MKQTITRSFKHILKDRPLAVATVLLLVLVLAFCLYAAIAIRASELQVVVRYTSFGITNFYRDQWFYLLTFIGFGLVIGAANTAVAAKLLQLKGRQHALFFIWLSIGLIAIAFVTARSVLSLAALS